MSKATDKYKELFQLDDFNMYIEDGKMIFVPSEAGVILLSMLELNNTELEETQDELVDISNELEKKMNELGIVKNFLEEIRERLNDTNPQISEEILAFLYPITVVDKDGNEVKVGESNE